MSRNARASARSADLALPLGVIVGIAASTALRWRTLHVALTSDEGGYLAVARAWSHGATLYRDAWVDRPQGMLLLFRLCNLLGGGNGPGVRVMAMLAAAVVVVSCASIATTIAGRRAGACAAVLVGITISSPGIEGHIANGELLSGAFVTAGLAVGCLAIAGGRSTRWYVVAGALGGAALMVKQSGFDGLVALAMCLGVGAARRHWSPRDAAVRVGWLAAGAAAPIALGALHGALTGWSRWWYAVIGYRLQSRSAVTGSDWSHLQSTLWPAFKVLGAPAGVAALVVLAMYVPAVRSRLGRMGAGVPPGPVRVVLVAWPAVAVVGFVAGGLFHLHYWVLLCPSVCVAAAAVIANRLDARRTVVAVALACLAPIVASALILREPLDVIPSLASRDGRGPIDQQVAAWYREHAGAGDRLWVMCASAAFYAAAREDPPYPYLWLDNILDVPGAKQRLRELLQSPQAPRFIAVYQPASACDPSGALGIVVGEHYHPTASVGVVQVLERTTTS